jgi:hypothetical protein
VLARLADAGAAGAFNPRAIEYAARKVPPAARARARPTLNLASSTRRARCRARRSRGCPPGRPRNWPAGETASLLAYFALYAVPSSTGAALRAAQLVPCSPRAAPPTRKRCAWAGGSHAQRHNPAWQRHSGCRER